MGRMIGCTLALFALPASLSGQTLSQRIAALGNGNLRLSFAAREGVCGSSHEDTSYDQRNKGDTAIHGVASPTR